VHTCTLAIAAHESPVAVIMRACMLKRHVYPAQIAKHRLLLLPLLLLCCLCVWHQV
jgi:hypothetical protein